MEAMSLVTAVLNFIILIVFFMMSGNVAAIRRAIEKHQNNPAPTAANKNYADYFTEGELNESLGKKQEALESYRHALFFVEKKIVSEPKDKAHIRNKEKIQAKLSQLS